MVPGRVLLLPYGCGAGGTMCFVLLYLDGLLQGALLPSTFGSASGRVSECAGYDIHPDRPKHERPRPEAPVVSS